MVMQQPQGVNVNLGLADIYSRLCPTCQKELREMIRGQITDQMVDQVIGIPQSAKTGQEEGK